MTAGLAQSLRAETPSFKVCICGSNGVGKTALLHRRITRCFLTDYRPTIAAAFATVMESVATTKVLLNVWDTAGQEKYQSMMPLYYRSVACVLLVVDVTSPPSWEFAKRWVDCDLAAITPRPFVLIAANKSDLEADPGFQSGVIEWARQMQFPTFTTSATTGTAVDELFLEIARVLLERRNERPRPVNEVLTQMNEEESSCC
jgi:small GTP-binding protein